jgi:hypothetical protein
MFLVEAFCDVSNPPVIACSWFQLIAIQLINNDHCSIYWLLLHTSALWVSYSLFTVFTHRLYRTRM